MKTKQLLLLGIAAVLFSACVSEANISSTSESGNTVVRLSLIGSSPDARATGVALPTTDENTINSVTVGVFNTDGNTNTIYEFKTGEVTAKVADVACKYSSGATNKVYAVVNAPTGTFNGVANETAFVAKTVSLANTVTSGSQDAKKLPMSGKVEDLTFTNNGTVNKTVTVKRLVGRVAVSSIESDFAANLTYPSATFVLTDIFMSNVHINSTVNPGSPIGTTIVTGSNATYSYLANTVSNQAITTTPYTTPYWYYVFANDGASAPTRLVIKGQFDPDGGGSAPAETVYYPITIAKTQAGTTFTGGTGTATGNITANVSYNITVKIKGKGSASEGATIDPATVQVTVNVAAWDLTLNQEVTFN